MENDRINDIVALIEGKLPPHERANLLREFLEDPEAAELAQLMMLPELRASNNIPSPFTIECTHLVGFHEGFFIPVLADPIRFGQKMTSIRSHIERLFHGKNVPPITRHFDSQLPVKKKADILSLELTSDRSNSRINLSVSTQEKIEGAIEVWQQGSLRLKMDSSDLPEDSIFSFGLGDSVTIRHNSIPIGIEVMVIETDFTPQEWKAVLVSCCLEGRIREGLEVFKKNLLVGQTADLLQTTYRQISALARACKLDGFAILPVPATRSSTLDREDLVETFGIVWNGITECWPGAHSVPNPWSEMGGNGESLDEEGLLDDDVMALGQATIRVAGGEPLPEARPVKNESILNEGWAALYGWNAILKKDFTYACQEFSSTRVSINDPFGIELGLALSEHLSQASEFEGSTEPLPTNDQVWNAAFRDLI